MPRLHDKITAAGKELAFQQEKLLCDIMNHLSDDVLPHALKARMLEQRGVQAEWAANLQWANTRSRVFYEATALLAHLDIQLLDDTISHFLEALPPALALRVQEQRRLQAKWATAVGLFEFDEFCLDIYHGRDIDDNMSASSALQLVLGL